MPPNIAAIIARFNPVGTLFFSNLLSIYDLQSQSPNRVLNHPNLLPLTLTLEPRRAWCIVVAPERSNCPWIQILFLELS
jgi:hypothetical protein